MAERYRSTDEVSRVLCLSGGTAIGPCYAYRTRDSYAGRFGVSRLRGFLDGVYLKDTILARFANWTPPPFGGPLTSYATAHRPHGVLRQHETPPA